jgi:hypothetical protein
MDEGRWLLGILPIALLLLFLMLLLLLLLLLVLVLVLVQGHDCCSMTVPIHACLLL